MPSISLKIVQDDGAVTRKVKLDSRMTVQEAHKVVKEKVIVPNNGKEYALFLRSADDDLTGVWLEGERNLDYYMLRDGDSLDYICKNRNLRVRLLDGTVKTLQVDEAHTVIELLFQVCARIGITNHDEYGLYRDEIAEEEDGKESVAGTLTRKGKVRQKDRDEILEQMSKRLKTDDNVEWLDQHRTLREQGIDPSETLLLKRRLFFSDRNVDSRDPVQLNLLYVQTRDAILNEKHPVTEQQAVEFAGIHCQIHFGDYQEKKHKPGFLENLEEYLPKQYSNAWGVEKKILKSYSQHQGVSHLDAKYLYIKTARDLPTYGVTFFVVKEKQKDKKKLVPRLLGINAQSILRLDEVTKEILQTWPLTHVKTYHASKAQFFTLNFGDYSDKEYSVKTKDALRIRDILEGYIDIIRKRMLARPTAGTGESMVITHDNIQTGQSHIIQHVSQTPGKIVSETFVGPTKILPYDTGSQAQQGTQIMTVQQIVVTDHLQNQQHALKGEVPLRGDMSQECVRKLNRMNSNSVKIVTLLTDPTDVNVKDVQKIVANMQEDFPEVEKGVNETAEKQSIDEAKKMLQDELQDLKNYLNKLTENTKQGNVNPAAAKETAECIADLTTQLYFSIDPKTRRRSEMLRRSRKSFKAGEKSELVTRRASFTTAAASALQAVDNATHTIYEDYNGKQLDDADRRKLEKALEDRMGKLNAAIALYLTAHSDPENVDYEAAINSMNDINELMPDLARDALILGASKDAAGRKELQDDMRTLFEATRRVCGMNGTEDHEKMQEASNNYADIAGKLIFTFARGTNASDENKIIQLAKTAGDKASLLLLSSSELSRLARAEPAAPLVTAAGARTAAAARDLLACAQLTAPAIHEPHCQSALSAAAASLTSSVQQLQASCRPLLEEPARQHLQEPLHARATDVFHALEKLSDAYGALGEDDADASLPLQERQRLKFIYSMTAAKNKLQAVEELWSQSASGSSTEEDKSEVRRRLSQQMAQLNAAVAALAAATADRENPDYATAELAISTISQLMPQIVKDSEVVSSDKDEATRAAMLANVRALCGATRAACRGAEDLHGQSEAAANFAAASGKLVFLVSPGADKGKQKYVVEASNAAHEQMSELVSEARRAGQQLAPAAAEDLHASCARATDAAQALVAVAQVTAPSLDDPRCQDTLTSSLEGARSSAANLVASLHPHLDDQPELQNPLLKKQHQLYESLDKIAHVIQMGQNDVSNDASAEASTEHDRQRLKFISSTTGAKEKLDKAQQRLDQPLVCQLMKPEAGVALESKLSQRMAQLNAAVAALAAATADRKNPDYAGAEQAVATISELMPGIVQDSRTLCGTKTDAEQAKMLQELRGLCEATRELCDNAGQPQGVGDAAAKFSVASGKLTFILNPSADNGKENKVVQLSAAACEAASALLAQAERAGVGAGAGGGAAGGAEGGAEGGAGGGAGAAAARAADAAQALQTVAQVTASSINNRHCQRALIAAAERLRESGDQLASSCKPLMQDRPDLETQLLGAHKHLDKNIDRLVQACKKRPDVPSRQTSSSGMQEKQRLQFISSMSGAKNRLDAAEQQLNEPLVRQLMKPEAGSALQSKLSQRLAHLNAAVAELAAATADREHPDCAAAEHAVKTITDLMPGIVQDSRTLCGTKTDAEQAKMLQELRGLCEATRELCDNAGQPQGLGEAAAKFSAASGNLVFLISPNKHTADREQQVIDLAAAACGKASELLSQVQVLEQQLQEKAPAAAAELDACGARTADAAQALITVAQITAASISDASCSASLTSAAEQLRGTARALTDACRAHAGGDALLGNRREVDEAIDRLLQACKKEDGDRNEAESTAQQEKKRLKFISSVSGAKSRLDAAEQQLSQPLVCQLMKPEAGSALQSKLSQRLAHLNAAVAKLAAATADREHPDYAAAELAAKTITELMPGIVQDSRTLCGTKTDADQAKMLQELRGLCEATRELCDNAGQPQGLGEAAAKFSAASGNLVFLISPNKHAADREQQVIDLAAAACGKASELLSQVQVLEQQLQEKAPAAAAELDACGARTADAAQALITVAQITAASISDASCSASLRSAAEQLRGTARALTDACRAHAGGDALLGNRREVDEAIDRLLQACKKEDGGQNEAESSAQQEKKRLKFISSVSGAKSRLDAAEQQLSQPLVCQLMKPEAGSALQSKLSQRLAHLNAAVAKLAAANTDRGNPDYAAAEQAINTITEIMPHVVQDSRTLCGTKDKAGQAAMLQDLRILCEASRELCDSSVQQEGLSEAATKFSAASGKLVFLVSPSKENLHEQKVIDLTAVACGKASELLSQVQALEHQLQEKEPAAAAELDARGARTADAAQALLTVAQVTAPSIDDAACGTALSSAVEQLRQSSQQLTASCQQASQPEGQQMLNTTQQKLEESLQDLLKACYAAQPVPEPALSPQQEKQRVKFVTSVSRASGRLDAADQQLHQPQLRQLLKPEDSSKLQQQLSSRLAHLNAAVAALTAATSDGKNPDYPAAERAVITITELMPQIAYDSRALSSSLDEAGRGAMLQEMAALCDAARALCTSSGQPKELNEASAKLADVSKKLLFVVSPGQRTQEKHVGDLQTSSKPQPAQKPAVPVRDPKNQLVTKAVPTPALTSDTQGFLDRLRHEEAHDNKARVVSMTQINAEKSATQQYAQLVQDVEKQLDTAEKELKLLYNAKSIKVAGQPISAVEVANREQHMEDTLATAGVELATLVAANYADKLDYKAATEPTIALTKSVKSVVDDVGIISGSLRDSARQALLSDALQLCRDTRSVCLAARTDRQKLNDSAIEFGNQSAKLLQVVSSDVNPTLERELISRAKAIGDTASRIALEASDVATSDSMKAEENHVQEICTAGANCVDAAGKLVYTAKLVAPTIHHTTCQDAVTSSADSLSTSLATLSKTLAPLTYSKDSGVGKLAAEVKNLEGLVEKLKRDVKAGELGRRKGVERLVVVDTPLRQMTMQIIDNARNLAECGDMPAELKKEYSSYSSRLTRALQALDLANARYQRAAHDKEKREEMEIAIQDLQMTLLQTRPSQAGQEQNNIVDFRDFLQELVKEADELQGTAKQHEGPAGKKATEEIKLVCSKISQDATKLLNPSAHEGDGVTVLTSVDDVMDIDEFGQECDDLVKKINTAILGIQDQKAKQALRVKALSLAESCNLLRFATNCHISATKTAAFDEVLQELDNFEETVIQPIIKDVMKKKEKKAYASSPAWSSGDGAGLVRAASAAAAGRPQLLRRALTRYAADTARQAAGGDSNDSVDTHLNYVLSEVYNVTSASCRRLANWETDSRYSSELSSQGILKNLNDLDYKFTSKKLKTPILNEEDINKLLLCQQHKVQGTEKQLQDKLQQLGTQLSSMSGVTVLSVKAPESLGRSLRAAAGVAAQLAGTARGLKVNQKPEQCAKIEDAAHEMCLATYSMMKTAEIVCQNPSHHNARRRLLDVCHHLNDTINQLVRAANPASKVSQECGELQRSMQLQRSLLQSTPQPCGALPYDHCLDTLQSQREVLLKVNSDQAMSREEFLKSMHYVASAVNNSTDCAAHAAYLLSVSEKDVSIGKEGIVDVPKLHKTVEVAQDTCVSIIMNINNQELIQEEKKTLESQVDELLSNLETAREKTRSAELKQMLKKCREDVQLSAKAFYNVVDQDKPKDVRMSSIMSLMDGISSAGHLLEHPDLVPIAREVSADTTERCLEVVKSSLELLKNTEDLIREVKNSEQPEMMKWVMFNKRKDVLDAFDALLKSIKSNGQRANLLEASEEPEEEKKSYVQKQFEAASKWLLNPATKAEVKSNGQQAVRNLIEVANKVAEDLKGSDKEDMKHIVTETQELLTECCKKYDHEQYSILMERVRDLKKGIERGVVTRVVEDFMEAEAPLQDLDLLADHETDETKRKFILEKKIAELLAQLSRVTKTARLIADTDDTSGRGIKQCSQQVELLAPKLVKAAQKRVASPDDKAAIENYQALLAQYAESLSKIRDLCDQSVDPMDFVQTAGQTMERMRDESKTHNDPMKCAHTSAVITKLANRVIHVGLSSSSARADPELQRSLAAAQAQLAAAAPAPDARASRLPDWKDTTAKILRATDEVESLLGGDSIFKQQPEPNQPIYNEALNLHVAIRGWSSRDNEIVAVAKRMAVLMAKLSNFMNNDKQRDVLATSKSIVQESHEVARLAKKLAHECTDHRIKTNLLQTCQRIPTISGQLKMLTTVKGFSLGRHGTQEDKEAMDMLVGNAQSLMLSIQDVVKVAASASVKIMSQHGPRMKWVRRKTSY